jgi:hypothetical protein
MSSNWLSGGKRRKFSLASVAPVLFVLLLLSLFWVGFSIGASLGGLPAPRTPFLDGPAPPDVGAPPGQVDAPSLPVYTADRTVLTFITSYTECGCTERESRTAGDELAGLEESSLAARLDGWAVAAFSGSAVELHRVITGLCPEMTTYRTLGVHDGKVAVFLGRPTTGLLLREVTNIPVETLPYADRDRLAAGIVVRGDQDIEVYLEGLHH